MSFTSPNTLVFVFWLNIESVEKTVAIDNSKDTNTDIFNNKVGEEYAIVRYRDRKIGTNREETTEISNKIQGGNLRIVDQ